MFNNVLVFDSIDWPAPYYEKMNSIYCSPKCKYTSEFDQKENNKKNYIRRKKMKDDDDDTSDSDTAA